MALTPVQNMQLHNQIERVLHVPGNYRGGILEMAIVIDRDSDKEKVRALCADIITSCKRQSEIFRNVRLNMVLWGEKEICTRTVASAYVQMGTFFEDYEPENAQTEKQTEEIMEYLKKFHARSKLILLLAPDYGRFCQIRDPDRLRVAMSPFLKQKLVIVSPDKIWGGTEFFLLSC